MLACYRSADLIDPETFSAVITATLAEYPEVVVARVTDPMRGIPSKIKFLPSVAEVREWCDKEYSLFKKPDWLVRMDEVRYNTLAGRFGDYLRRGLISQDTYDMKMDGLRTGKATTPLVMIEGPK